jgi:hypothetical protein
MNVPCAGADLATLVARRPAVRFSGSVQPRATVDVMLDGLGLPIPEHWSEPVEAGMVKIAMFLEVGLYATDFRLPVKRGAEVVGRV